MRRLARFRRNYLLRTVLIAASVLALSGCLEVVQHIGPGAGNTVETYVRLTLQRAIFQFAESFGGDPVSDEELTEQFGLTESEVLQDLPEGISARFEPFVNEYDVGFVLRTTTPRSFRAEEGVFVPTLAGNELRVRLPPGNEGDGGSNNGGEAAFFLASAKYRVLLEKAVWPSVSGAVILPSEGEEVDVQVTEFAGLWLIEFPVLVWMSAGENPVLTIRG